MKIVVVGTSNSVMGNKGYIEALRQEHEVIQLSLGRVPFFYHIKAITENKGLIESSDLLIVDHYVNDIAVYYEEFGQPYTSYLREFYKFLSTINTHILNLLFPIRDLKKRGSYEFYELVLTLSKEHSLSILDLNQLEFSSHHFQDKIHLTHDVSFLLGVVLCDELPKFLLSSKPSGGVCNQTPFEIVMSSSIDSKNELKTYKNSLVEVQYLDLKYGIDIHKDAELVSIGYLKPKEKQGLSGVKINGQQYAMVDSGYYHEAINCPLIGSVAIEPLIGKALTVPNLKGKDRSHGDFEYCYLTELMFHNKNLPIRIKAANRELIELNVTRLVYILNRLSESSQLTKNVAKPTQKTIKYLMELAISNEKENMQLSYELMQILRQLRPTGPVILKKLDEYKSKL